MSSTAFGVMPHEGETVHTPFPSCYPGRGRHAGKWTVSLKLPNVWNGETYGVIGYTAVQDDFGTLVAISTDSGKVVLQ